MSKFWNSLYSTNIRKSGIIDDQKKIDSNPINGPTIHCKSCNQERQSRKAKGGCRCVECGKFHSL